MDEKRKFPKAIYCRLVSGLKLKKRKTGAQIVMSHEISNIDKQEGIEQAWHGLTVVKKVIELAQSWLAQWDVEKRPMHEPDGMESEFCRVVCTDDPSIRIGKPVHCDTYGLVTNADFLRVVSNALKEIPGAIVASVGSVRERSRIFVSVKLPELATYQAAGREFIPFLNFMSSHDMSAPFAVNASNICTVCNNTFGMNLASFGKQVSGLQAAQLASEKAKAVRILLKHSKNVGDRLENVPEIISGFHGSQMLFRVQMEKLAMEKVTIDDANALFTGFLTPENAVEKEISTRRENQIERLVELFRYGAGNNGENRADLFSAFTDYYSHESSGGDNNRLKQFESSEYGDGFNKKREAFDTLTSDALFAQTLKRGQLVLANN